MITHILLSIDIYPRLECKSLLNKYKPVTVQITNVSSCYRNCSGKITEIAGRKPINFGDEVALFFRALQLSPLHVTSVPPLAPSPPPPSPPILLTPEDQIKLHLPLQTSINYGSTLNNFLKIKASLPKNSIFFYPTPQLFMTYPEEFNGPSTGETEIKCNSRQ